MLAKQSSGAVLDLRDHLTPTPSRSRPGTRRHKCRLCREVCQLPSSLCLLRLRVEKARALSGAGTSAHRLPASPPELFPAGPVASKFCFVVVVVSSLHNAQKPLAAEAPTRSRCGPRQCCSGFWGAFGSGTLRREVSAPRDWQPALAGGDGGRRGMLGPEI